MYSTSNYQRNQKSLDHPAYNVAGEGPSALWVPNDIARIAESCFRKHTRIGKPTSLHVDKVIKNVLAPPLAKSLWNDIIEQSNSIAVSKECQSLCFENIVLNCTCMAVQSFKFCHLSCSSPISGSERPDSQPKSACQAGWSFYCLTAPHSKGTFCTF